MNEPCVCGEVGLSIHTKSDLIWISLMTKRFDRTYTNRPHLNVTSLAHLVRHDCSPRILFGGRLVMWW